jgi:hypothetical protein
LLARGPSYLKAAVRDADPHLAMSASSANPTSVALITTPRRRHRRRAPGVLRLETLTALERHPGLRIPELARVLSFNQSALYRILPLLEKDGEAFRDGRRWYPRDTAVAGGALGADVEPVSNQRVVTNHTIAVLYTDISGYPVSEFASEGPRRLAEHERYLHVLAGQWARDAGREIRVGEDTGYSARLREEAGETSPPHPRGPRRLDYVLAPPEVAREEHERKVQYEQQVEELGKQGLIKADVFAEIITQVDESPLAPEHFVVYDGEEIIVALHRDPAWAPDYFHPISGLPDEDLLEEDLCYEMKICLLIRDGHVNRHGLVLPGELIVVA